jgi:hypothetical protein
VHLLNGRGAFLLANFLKNYVPASPANNLMERSEARCARLGGASMANDNTTVNPCATVRRLSGEAGLAERFVESLGLLGYLGPRTMPS